jgi:hypothetical protein
VLNFQFKKWREVGVDALRTVLDQDLKVVNWSKSERTESDVIRLRFRSGIVTSFGTGKPETNLTPSSKILN